MSACTVLDSTDFSATPEVTMAATTTSDSQGSLDGTMPFRFRSWCGSEGRCAANDEGKKDWDTLEPQFFSFSRCLQFGPSKTTQILMTTF